MEQRLKGSYDSWSFRHPGQQATRGTKKRGKNVPLHQKDLLDIYFQYNGIDSKEKSVDKCHTSKWTSSIDIGCDPNGNTHLVIIVLKSLDCIFR